jgi:hypothetical protein
MDKPSRDNALHILANADCEYATEKDLLQCYYSNAYGFYSSLSDEELLEELRQLQKLKEVSA